MFIIIELWSRKISSTQCGASVLHSAGLQGFQRFFNKGRVTRTPALSEWWKRGQHGMMVREMVRDTQSSSGVPEDAELIEAIARRRDAAALSELLARYQGDAY